MRNVSIHTIAEIGILTAMMTILGGIKIPNLIPGVEFQLSAPLAVAICAAFGFRKYIICGCLSSLIGLVLGTQNLLNVAIAMQFRLIVGLILWIGKNLMWSILISGPIASAIARITIGLSFGKMVIPMLVMAVPGMIFTVIVSPIFYSILHRLPRLATTLKVKQG